MEKKAQVEKDNEDGKKFILYNVYKECPNSNVEEIKFNACTFRGR